MQRISKAIWVWCEFCDEDTTYLNNIKSNVQNKLKSPKFDIHLTLSGPFEFIDKQAICEIKKIAHSQKQIKLNCVDYYNKNDFFESFYISLDASKDLYNLRNQIFIIQGIYPQFEFNPHISLAYGNHKIFDKIELKKKLPKLKKTLTIDKICIVDVNEEIKTWKIINKFRMGKSNKN